VRDVNLGVGDAGLAKGEAVRGPQVEQPVPGGGVRDEEGGRGGAEGLGDGLVNVGTDLVAAGRDGGADPREDI
jgi:hypothetical protein